MEAEKKLSKQGYKKQEYSIYLVETNLESKTNQTENIQFKCQGSITLYI